MKSEGRDSGLVPKFPTVSEQETSLEAVMYLENRLLELHQRGRYGLVKYLANRVLQDIAIWEEEMRLRNQPSVQEEMADPVNEEPEVIEAELVLEEDNGQKESLESLRKFLG
jgi:hypothetical protein